MSFTVSESRWRDVYFAATARGVSVAGDFLAATALALALQSAGAGGLAVSGMMLAIALPLVVLAPLTGRLVDRVDSRTLLVASGLWQMLICAALAFAEHPVAIITLCALLSSGLAVTSPTLAALLPAMVTRDDLPRASAINQTASSVGIMVAPAAAGFLVGQFGVRVPLLIDAACYLAIVAAGLLIRTRRGGAHPAPMPADKPAASTAWRLRRDPLLGPLMVALAATLSVLSAINVVTVFFIRETLRSSETVFGLVEAVWAGGLLLGSWLVAMKARQARDEGILAQAMIVMFVGTSLVVLSAAAVPSVIWLVPIFVVGGMLNGGENVVGNVIMGRRVPPAVRGRAFAAFAAAIQGASMVGYLVGGLLLEVLAPRPLIVLVGGGALLVTAVSVIPIWRAVGRERATAAGHRRAPAAAEATDAVVGATPVPVGD
ncbi:MAG TPA: MFS transporter [Micromonosporaceae bacterium]|nr:MFS transporter [Micromonosporaceae bacterium]